MNRGEKRQPAVPDWRLLNPNGRSRVLEETVEAIKSLIADRAWKAKGYLPGLRDMARLVGCSHYTMWKAVKVLEGQGSLEVRPGRRIRIPRDGDEEEGAPSGRARTCPP